MRDWLRLLGMLRRYRQRTSLLIVSIIFASILSTVGITFISPVLRILFMETPTPATEMAQPSVDRLSEGGPDAEPANGAKTEPGGGVETEPGGGVKAEPGGGAKAEPGGGAETEPGGGVQAHRPQIPVSRELNRARANIQDWIEARLYRGNRQAMLMRISVLLFLLYLAKNLFTFAQGALTAALEQKIIYDIRRELFETIERKPLAFFSEERTGYLMSRVIIDVDMMRGALVGCAAQILSNSIMVVLAMTLVIWWSWQLSLATLLVVPPNILLVNYLSRKLRKGSHRTQESMGDLATVLQEAIAGIRIVKAFTTERLEEERYDRHNLRYYRAYTKMKILEALSSPVSEVLGVATAVVVLGFGGHLVLQGRLRPDLLITFLGVMLWVIGPIKNLIKVNSTLQQSLAAARRVFLVIDGEREERREAGRSDIAGLKEALVYEDVDFRYRTGEPVLRNIDLSIPAGSSLAVVGPSGAGKSTLVDLLPRFYHPTRGRILIDGIDIEEIELETLRSLIGVVTQEVILFHDTVKNNISYGSSGASLEEIEAAATAANAHEFISSLAQGYDTTVGERGSQLSGGQRQRIAIARAILRDPPILIFDEATSALDSESERLVQEAMQRLMKGRTTIVIAHRLSTIVGADRIVVMEKGHIVEQGVHQELLEMNGAYRRLYELQFARSGA